MVEEEISYRFLIQRYKLFICNDNESSFCGREKASHSLGNVKMGAAGCEFLRSIKRRKEK